MAPEAAPACRPSLLTPAGGPWSLPAPRVLLVPLLVRRPGDCGVLAPRLAFVFVWSMMQGFLLVIVVVLLRPRLMVAIMLLMPWFRNLLIAVKDTSASRDMLPGVPPCLVAVGAP